MICPWQAGLLFRLRQNNLQDTDKSRYISVNKSNNFLSFDHRVFFFLFLWEASRARFLAIKVFYIYFNAKLNAIKTESVFKTIFRTLTVYRHVHHLPFQFLVVGRTRAVTAENASRCVTRGCLATNAFAPPTQVV